ncbi:hypothetical protein ACP275_04G202700 [Erythranthe tilingii]
MNMVRSLLTSSNIPKQFWPEAVNWSIHILNRSPTLAVQNMTPEQAWSGRKPTIHGGATFVSPPPLPSWSFHLLCEPLFSTPKPHPTRRNAKKESRQPNLIPQFEAILLRDAHFRLLTKINDCLCVKFRRSRFRIDDGTS